MATDTQLTILLTLKGRNPFTLRWLWHANRVCLPYHIFIADGEVHPTLAGLIKDPKVFPNLSIEYHCYDDQSYSHYYRKVVDALSKISTPYVMMSDNDDFLFPSGIMRSIAFLNDAPEYVCAGGSPARFMIKPFTYSPNYLQGEVIKLDLSGYLSRDLDDPLAAKRVIDQFRNPRLLFYNVYRKADLLRMFREIVEHDFGSLTVFEIFLWLRTVTLGKVKSDAKQVSYLRQIATSSSTNISEFSQNAAIHIHNLIHSHFAADVQATVTSIAAIAAQTDGVDRGVVEDELREVFTARQTGTLTSLLSSPCSFRLMVKRLLPEFVSDKIRALIKKKRQIKSNASFTREHMFKSAAAAGASTELIAGQRRELAEIEESLQSPVLLAFIQLYAPDLLQKQYYPVATQGGSK